MPWDRSRYPKGWRAIVRAVRDRCGGQCECSGECGRHAGPCPAQQFDPTGTGWRVYLTTAHLWQGPCAEHHAAGIKCGELDHLKAMCQRCHLNYDLPQHMANAAATRATRRLAARAARACGDLFGP